MGIDALHEGRLAGACSRPDGLEAYNDGVSEGDRPTCHADADYGDGLCGPAGRGFGLRCHTFGRRNTDVGGEDLAGDRERERRALWKLDNAGHER